MVTDAYRDDLAFIHDAGFGSFARSASRLLLDDLRRRGVPGGQVIDLGCGSGILAAELASAGYEVLGIDVSSAFVALAQQRVPQGRFEVGSMFRSQLAPCVAIAAVGECFNYQFDPTNSPESLGALFGRAFQVLADGGALLFDIAEPGRLPGSGTFKTFTEGDGWAVLTAADEDRQHGLLTRRRTTFREVGGLYRRDHEHHSLRLLSRDEVAAQLRSAGFQVQIITSYGSLPFAHGHVGFWASKSSKDHQRNG